MANICKYWIDYEPVPCTYWDVAKTICTFLGNSGELAPLAPYCNLIGTSAYQCDKYTSSAEEGQESTAVRCVLPDPIRHVRMKGTCEKWVRSVEPGVDGASDDRPVYTNEIADTEEGSQGLEFTDTGYLWTFDDITGYNEGQCDGYGTTITCKGYSPYHMAFGKLKPKPLGSEDLSKPEEIETCLTADELGYRTPLPYDIFNIRALLSRCYWWEGDMLSLDVDSVTGYANTIAFNCKNTDTQTVNDYNDHRLEEDYGYVAPCNGAKPECAYYTGLCWRFCIDDKMGEGDKVLAEQVMELRYNIRKERWDDKAPTVHTPDGGFTMGSNVYYASFNDPELYAWAGTYTLHGISENSISATIHSVKNYFEHFDYLDIKYASVPLAAGTPADNQTVYFPTLIEELKQPNLRPIIRNVFDLDKKRNSQGDEEGSGSIDYMFRGRRKLFEVGDLDHKDIIIWGDSFWHGDVIALNLSDPDLTSVFPMEILEFNSMLEIKEKLGEDKFNIFHDKVIAILINIELFASDKIFYSEIKSTDSTLTETGFYIPVKTFFSGINDDQSLGNNIIVFDRGSPTLEFDKILFSKLFCGGVVGQTSFNIYGDGGTLERVPDYEAGFNAHINENGNVCFDFFSLNKGQRHGNISYVYNDALLENKAGHTYYKVKVFENLELEPSQVKFFGNTGKAMLILPDYGKLLNYVHRDYELDGTFYLSSIDVNGKDKLIELEITEWCTDRLENNQILVQPKNFDEFRSPCGTVTLDGSFYIYQKRSFGEEPTEPEDLAAYYIYPGIVFDYVEDPVDYYTRVGIFSHSNGSCTLESFSDLSLLVSVVYTSSKGRVKGVARTKLITWVRQPKSRDVEILYRWEGVYDTYDVYPRGYRIIEDYDMILTGHTTHSYSPWCADHDKSLRTPSNKMWYPYDQCDQTAHYTEISSSHPNISTEMEVFWGDDNQHGSHDLRMLGPSKGYGHEESHASLWECTADFFYFNDLLVPNTDNQFRGYGNYRGALDAAAYERCVFDVGVPPKFGNVCREQMNSFRSTDYAAYYVKEGGQWSTTPSYKWMPAQETFSSSLVIDSAIDLHYDLFTNDHTTQFNNQFGFLIASTTIEGIETNETVDTENKYRFEEIINVDADVDRVTYPKPRPQKYYGVELSEWNVNSTYKNYPEAGSESIHWVWQEPWYELKRYEVPIESIRTTEDPSLSATYVDSNTSSAKIGRHSFIDLEHPNYRRDFKQNEYRLVCDKEEYFVNIRPITIKDDSEDVIFSIDLENGPPRVFDLNGNWVTNVPDEIESESALSFTDLNKSIDLYRECSGSSWVNDVTLFDPTVSFVSGEDQIEKAKNDDREIRDYDHSGDVFYKYFNRGLNLSINKSKLTYLPKRYALIEEDKYECMFDKTPEGTPIETGEFYPSDVLKSITYDSSTGTASIVLDFRAFDGEDYINRHISSVGLLFSFGPTADPSSVDPKLYHIPAISCYTKKNKSSDYVNIYSRDMNVSELPLDPETGEYEVEEKNISLVLDIDELNYCRYFKIEFGINLSEAQLLLTNDTESLYSHKMQLLSLKLYGAKYVDASEPIQTYEREYYVSHGTHGDLPPHGTDATGNILFPLYDEKSTYYQKDTTAGILGAGPGSEGVFKTMNKCRGRLLKECHEDLETLPGKDIIEWEKEQVKLFNEGAVDQGKTFFTMESVSPPGLEEKLTSIHKSLRFPDTWRCYFINSFVCNIPDVLQRERYNSAGWYWVPGVPKLYDCGRKVGEKNIFQWEYTNTDTGSSYIGYDWHTAQYIAAVNRFESGIWASLFNGLSGGLWSSDTYYSTGGRSTVDESNTTEFFYP